MYVKLRTKVEVFCIMLLLVFVSMLSSIGTVTITDSSISDDVYGIVIDFDDDWMSISNMSAVDINISGNITLGGLTINASNITAWDSLSAGNPFNQELNSTDSPTFDNITLTSFPNLDKDSSDDFDGNYSNLTSKPSNFTSDDFSDNDSDDLSEGSTNFWCTLSRMRSLAAGDWMGFSNATFSSNITINGMTITDANISAWDSLSAGNPFNQELNSTDGPSFVNITVDDRLLNSTDFDAWDESSADGNLFNGSIWNSNNNFYPVTEAGLQDAVNNLNNLSGSVHLPICDITLTDYIEIGTGCELYGVGDGSILRLGDDANTTMVRNYDRVNGNDFIKIHNIRFEGNSEGQDVYYAPGEAHDPWYARTNAIDLKRCNYPEIYSVITNSTQCQGVLLEQCRWANVHDSMFLNSGISFDGSGLAHYGANGIYFFNTTDSIGSNLIIDNAYSYGILTEGYYNSPEAYWTKNITINNCIVTNTGGCYYVEDAKHIIFNGCTAIPNTDDACTGANTATGFRIASASPNKYITISNCIIRNTYQGITANGQYLLITGNQIEDITATAIYSYIPTNHSIITNNIITGCGDYGILAAGHNNTISSNYIYDTGAAEAAIRISSSEDTIVIGNTIIKGQMGVYGANSDVRSYVMFNQIIDCSLEIYQVAGRVNCTGYDDWNFYDGVS